jgi:hypothetical protein
VDTVLPPVLARPEQLETGLVYEIGGLKRMTRTLSREMAFRKPAQFFVDRLQKLVASDLVPSAIVDMPNC